MADCEPGQTDVSVVAATESGPESRWIRVGWPTREPAAPVVSSWPARDPAAAVVSARAGALLPGHRRRFGSGQLVACSPAMSPWVADPATLNPMGKQCVSPLCVFCQWHCGTNLSVCHPLSVCQPLCLCTGWAVLPAVCVASLPSGLGFSQSSNPSFCQTAPPALTVGGALRHCLGRACRALN